MLRSMRSWIATPGVMLSAVAILGACGETTDPARKGPSGNVLWYVPSRVTPLGVTPLIPDANADRSMTYFATADHRIQKVRGSDGTVIWDVPTGISYDAQVPGGGATLSGSVVALSVIDVFAFDTATGRRLWRYMPSLSEETAGGGLAANAITIFASSNTGRAHAIDAQTGVARWVTDLSEGKARVGAYNPRVYGDRVFVCSKDFTTIRTGGTFWALDAATGVVHWSYTFTAAFQHQSSSCLGRAAAWHDLVIQPAEDGRIYAFEQATGTVRWIAPMVPPDSANAYASDNRWPTVGGDIVVVTSVGGWGAVVAYDAATGVERWRRSDFGGSVVAPIADATTVYVYHGWVLAAYDIATGSIRWASPPAINGYPMTMYFGTPILANDRMFVAGRDGLYALRR